MVGRKALSLLSVAAVALTIGSSAMAQTRASAGLAGFAFPTASRDWSSDPGGYKGASLDLAAALAGKACGPQEFHSWTIADFAAGVALSERVDEAFRTAGWRLDLVSRDSEVSRIFLASRGANALILNWMPDEGVVGLLMCVAAAPGSVPERVAEAAPSNGLSLDPTLPPLPRPAPPRGEAAIAAAALAASEAAAPVVPAEDATAVAAVDAPAVAEPSAAPDNAPLLADLPDKPVTDEASGAAATVADILPADAASSTAEAIPPAVLAVTASDRVETDIAPVAPPTAQGPVLVAAAEPIGSPIPASNAPAGASLATTAPIAIGAPSPTRVPIDLGMTAAIAEPTPEPPLAEEIVVAAVEAAPTGPQPTEPLSSMYERVPPPAGLVNPRSVAEHEPAPVLRAQAVTPDVIPVRPVPLLTQGSPAARPVPPAATAVPQPETVRAERVPVTTVLAPAIEPRGALWPFFLLAVILAGSALAILFRSRPAGAGTPALWPTTLASVVGADLDERVGKDGIQFTPVLRYRFAVGENEFEAVTEGWGGRTLATRSAAEAVLANFPEHARVEISYDPTDPTRIALPEAEASADPLLMVAVACLCLAALTLVWTLF